MMTKYDIQSTMEEVKRNWASDYEAFEEFIADGDQLLRSELVNKVDFPIRTIVDSFNIVSIARIVFRLS